MKRTPYTECRLYYDGAADLAVGHYLRTPAGSAYWITAMRQDGKRARRAHLVCLRWPADEIPAGATVHPLHWYSRNRSGRQAKTLPGRVAL